MLFMLLSVLPKIILDKSDTVGTLLPQKPVTLEDTPQDHLLPHMTRPQRMLDIHTNPPRQMMKFDYSYNQDHRDPTDFLVLGPKEILYQMFLHESVSE